MTSLLMGLLSVLLIPLFVSKWRISLLGLSVQGLLMAWIAFRTDPHPSLDSALTFVDLALVRAVLAPLVLYLVLHDKNAPRRNDVIPPNMLSWTAALGLVLLAFQFAGIVVPQQGDGQTLVAVSAAAFLLGFLVLATQSGPFSQMVGALRIENAIALFELGGKHHHESPLLRVAQIAVVVASLGLYRWYLRSLTAAENAPAETESPAL